MTQMEAELFEKDPHFKVIVLINTIKISLNLTKWLICNILYIYSIVIIYKCYNKKQYNVTKNPHIMIILIMIINHENIILS